MDARAFFFLVKRCRQAQREYFATRTQPAKRKAIALEREIDAEILRVMDVLAERDRQQNEG